MGRSKRLGHPQHGRQRRTRHQKSTTDALVITVEAADTDIAAYQDVVGRHLERFGERDGLRVHWLRSQAK